MWENLFNDTSIFGMKASSLLPHFLFLEKDKLWYEERPSSKAFEHT